MITLAILVLLSIA